MRKNPYFKLWLAFALTVVVSFGILGYYGTEIYRKAPPYPAVVQTSGDNPRELFTHDIIFAAGNAGLHFGWSTHDESDVA